MGIARGRLVLTLLLLTVLAAGCSDSSKRKNPRVDLGAPTGPGTPTGPHPAYQSAIIVGDSLSLTITATDPKGKDVLSIDATVTGGSLTAAQAGFTTPAPWSASGASPLTLALDGVAASVGDVEITFEADDGTSRVETVTLTIDIGEPPYDPVIGAPTGPGTVTGVDPAYAASVAPGGLLDFTVTATDLNGSDTIVFDATVTGGTLTAAQAGFNETFPVGVTGVSPQIIGLTGTAGVPGDIEITFIADDGQGGTDTVTHTITILNDLPQVGVPSGPGVVSGTDPAFSTAVKVGDPLDFSATATDPNAADTLTLTATVTGGTLTAVQAGFSGIPGPAIGPSPQTLDFTGTAATAGEIEFTLAVDDGQGGSDAITHTIRLVNPGPEVTGLARYADVNRNGLADAGDRIVLQLTEPVAVSGATGADLALPVAGDTAGAGATVVAGPAGDEVTLVLGSSPRLKSRQTFDPSRLLPNDPSGIDVSPTLAADAIESVATGFDAIPSTPVDIIPVFVDSGQGLGGLYTVATTLADLDADGDADLVEGDLLGGGIRIWTNDGSGTFSDSGQSLGSVATTAVETGDLDGDGDLDIASASSGANGNRVWLNDGSGVFTDSGQSLGTGDTQDVALGDLDGDGDLDMIAANGGGQGNGVWLNDGAGTFISVQSLGTSDTWSIALGDVDRDGDLDIIAGNDGLQPNRVWLGDGLGTFSDSGQTLGAESTRAVALEDLDRDGDLDLAVGNVIAPAQIWWNDGSGAFSDSGQALGGGGTDALVLLDPDGDGDADLVDGNRAYLNDGQGILTDSGQTISLADPLSVSSADLDADGDLDLLIGMDGANQVWMGSLSGTWGTATLVDSGQTLSARSNYAAALGDLDGDGDLDLVVGVNGGGNQVWWNDGAGLFADSGQSLGIGDSWGIRLGDIDRDGDLDIAVGNRSGAPNKIWLNDGTGIFTDSGQNLGASTTSDVALGDLDGDGDLDLVEGNSVVTADWIWLNDGTGIFTDTGQRLGTDTTASASLGDVDADGDLDYFSMHTAGSPPVQIRLWINDGSATFADSGQSFAGGSIRYSADLGDLDGDGDLDLAAGGSGSNTFWRNDGTGIFTDSGQGVGSGTTFGTLLGDIDGDGDLDVFFGNIGSDPNQVFWNDGTGTFVDAGLALGAYSSYGACMGDVDRDGDLDFYAANASGDPDRLYLNR